MIPRATTPVAYIQSLQGERKKEIQTLHALIKKNAPNLTPFIQHTPSSDIIGYGKYAYKTTSGCKGDWFVIGLASRAQYISLYVLCTVDGTYLAQHYTGKLPKANIGKSCIRFKHLSDVDIDVISELVARAAALAPKMFSLSIPSDKR